MTSMHRKGAAHYIERKVSLKIGPTTVFFASSLVVLMVPAFGFAAYSSHLSEKQSVQTDEAVDSESSSGTYAVASSAAELRYLSEKGARLSTQAGIGYYRAFDQLRETREDFNRNLKAVVAAYPKGGTCEVEKLNAVSARFMEDTANIVATEAEIKYLIGVSKEIIDNIRGVQIGYEAVIDAMIEANDRPDQVAYAQRQSWLGERIVHSIRRVFVGGQNAESSASDVGRDADLLLRVLNGMISGDEILQIEKETEPDVVTSLKEVYGVLNTNFAKLIGEFLGTAPAIIFASDSAVLVGEHALEIQVIAKCISEDLSRRMN